MLKLLKLVVLLQHNNCILPQKRQLEVLVYKLIPLRIFGSDQITLFAADVKQSFQ